MPTHSDHGVARSVKELRADALRLKALGAECARLELDRLATSAAADDRSVAGYALAWYAAASGAARTAQLADPLIADEHWTVREAATFGIREALIAAYEPVRPVVRQWAKSGHERAHRAFIVAARQPRRQRTEAVAELIGLLAQPLSDPGPYVRKNVPFCLNYLARTHPVLLAAELPRWAAARDPWLDRACLVAVQSELAAAQPQAVRDVIAVLRTSPDASVRRRISQLLEA